MEKINIKPLGDRVVIKPAPAEDRTASGIIIPDTAKEKPRQGVVVAIPAENKETPITVKVNDQVLYAKYAGTEINIEGVDYLIMSEKDILAVI
ncbi:MAG: co-chaperone GroES [Bacteroidetes bacterium HGW-Bacteroidetes-16]|jgi:chaperonin GroES|nr:MAG: co-chaperone GroES [Bacteroidetes bacterium HGW-Bacteroidetes-16]